MAGRTKTEGGCVRRSKQQDQLATPEGRGYSCSLPKRIEVALIIRSAVASDAASIGNLARKSARYFRKLGDSTDFKLTAEKYLRDGFGAAPAFAGLVAECRGDVLGYLLYHFGYDSDRATRNLHIVDLYVDRAARRRGVGKALMARAAAIARSACADGMIWSVSHLNPLATSFYAGLGAKRISDVFFMQLKAEAI